jgi:iron complex outermembrane receptor protein
VPNVLASGLNIHTYFENVLQPINPALVSNPSGIPSRSRDFSQVQPKVSLSWRPNDTTNLYATYGVGFRSGGFNSLGSEALLNLWFNDLGDPTLPGAAVDAQLVIKDEYDKEVTDSFELGAKFILANNRLRINVALFRNEIEDNQFFEFFAGPFGLLRVVTTIEEVEISGFELDFDAVLGDHFSIFGGVGFLDSEIKQNINRPLSVGNDAPQAPEETYNLGAQVDYPLAGSMHMTFRVDWQYVGEMWYHTMQGEESPTIWNVFFGPPNIFDSNFSNAKRDAFDTIDARITISGEHWDLAIWGKNIANERYLEEIIPAIEFGGSFIHEAPGDSVGVEFTWRF